MKTARRRLWVVAVAAALICLSVSLGTWVVKRQGEVETVGWSPLFESRVERALTPLKTIEVTAQPAPHTQQVGCTRDCAPPPPDTKDECEELDTKDECEETVAGRTCETVDLTCGCDSWDEPCDLDTFAIAAPCPVPTQDATCYDSDPDCAETVDDTCDTCKDVETCYGETCDSTCATCEGAETCGPTCYDYYCDTLVGAATCDATVETCDGTCDGETCDAFPCEETWDDTGETCDGTCDGETCDATVETCDGTCDGETCDATVETCDGECDTFDLTCWGLCDTADATCMGLCFTSDATCIGGCDTFDLTCWGLCDTLDCPETWVCEPTVDCPGAAEPELEMDYGDAPHPSRHTRLAEDGARHHVDDVHYLGLLIDEEPDGQPNPAATGDDIPDRRDDEDGVWFTTSLLPGRTVSLIVEASTEGNLDAWVDSDNDGDWSGAGEQIFVAQPLRDGFNVLSFTAPRIAVEGPGFSRFRFSSLGFLSYTGPASDGEVEDHFVPITEVFGAAIRTDRMDYRQGEDATVKFYVNEAAEVRLVEDRVTLGPRVLWSGTVARGTHRLQQVPITDHVGRGTVTLLATSAAGSTTRVSTPFDVVGP